MYCSSLYYCYSPTDEVSEIIVSAMLQLNAHQFKE